MKSKTPVLPYPNDEGDLKRCVGMCVRALGQMPPNTTFNNEKLLSIAMRLMCILECKLAKKQGSYRKRVLLATLEFVIKEHIEDDIKLKNALVFARQVVQDAIEAVIEIGNTHFNSKFCCVFPCINKKKQKKKLTIPQSSD